MSPRGQRRQLAPMNQLVMIVLLAVQVFTWILIARALLSWFPASGWAGTAQETTSRITEPVVGPVRRVLPPLRIGGTSLDLSVLVVLVGLRWIVAPAVAALAA
jgi:YggT family protein